MTCEVPLLALQRGGLWPHPPHIEGRPIPSNGTVKRAEYKNTYIHCEIIKHGLWSEYPCSETET